MFWLIIGAMTLIALALVLRPLFAGRGEADPSSLHDLEVYRQQLAEVSAEVARGTLDDTSAQAARIEIERRMLQAADPAQGEPPARPLNRNLVAALVVVLVPALALPLYLHLGSPGMKSAIYADRPHHAGAEVQRAQILAMVTKLGNHLKEKPDDVRGWVLLGRSDVVLEDYAGAVAAYRAAARLAPDDADILTSFGEAQVYAAKGDVTPDALKAFQHTLKLAPRSPGALYYVALAKAQGGDLAGALKGWQALYAASPSDAAWMKMLKGQIRQAAVQLHQDPDRAVPKPKPPIGKAATGPAPSSPAAGASSAQPGPSAAEVEAAKNLSPAEQSKMIAAMVGRLADHLKADPADFTGWMRLGQAYAVLGQAAQAADAFSHAGALHPQDPEPMTREALALVAAAQPAPQTTGSALAQPAPSAAQPAAVPAAVKVPEKARALFQKALALDPENEAALWYLGLDAKEAGNAAAAAGYWQRLLAHLDPKSADHAELQKQLEALKGTAPR